MEVSVASVPEFEYIERVGAFQQLLSTSSFTMATSSGAIPPRDLSTVITSARIEFYVAINRY
eukprot:11588609-Ditylum_brightwellii.AAC.1